MKKLIIVFLFPLVMCSQSKKIFYVDYNYDEISFIRFSEKLNSKLYTMLIAENDSVIYKKIRPIEVFGRLDKSKKNQLKKLLNKRLKLDSTKIWFIHILESIPNLNNMPKESGIELLDSLNKPIGFFKTNKNYKKFYEKYYDTDTLIKTKNGFIRAKVLLKSKHRHLQSNRDFINNIVKEKNQVSKNIEFIHFFSTNHGYPIEKINKFNYYRDENSLIKRVFSDGLKNYNVIILFPNGNFYMTQQGKFKNQQRFLKEKYYQRKRKRWDKKMVKLK